jgi:hypothetical protein
MAHLIVSMNKAANLRWLLNPSRVSSSVLLQSIFQEPGAACVTGIYIRCNRQPFRQLEFIHRIFHIIKESVDLPK